ncbi:metallophosphoesterase [Butyrivibrio sp. LC3010]|uniref:metallophosphoesterase n=1 Tax=Butyrivibrio sp. LC3010 TaxID=1280680 RepID=UPI000406D775|nr:metallophosphoesterase [Butyrivibrio sp. LC3010]
MIYLILILILILILAVAVIAIIYHDMNNFVIRKYEIHSTKLTKDFTFCLLSDLHEKMFGDNNERLYDAICKNSPDIILIAGDMLTAFNEHGNDHYDEIGEFVARLSSKFPVYAANGNHETKMDILGGLRGRAYKSYEDKITKAGCVLLRNESIYLEDLNVEVNGLELERDYFRKVVKRELPDDYLENVFGKADDSRFQVLIAHNPIYFEEYAKWGADLTVSGHVHGGIIRLPFLGGVISPAMVLFPKYDGGLFKIGNKSLILSRGLSTHSIPVRFNNPGEVCMIRMLSDKK